MSFLLLAAALQSPFDLSPAQVRQCATLAQDRGQRIEARRARDDAIMAEQSALAARQTELTAAAAKVDTKKKKDVAAFNAASAAFNADVARNREKVAARNAAPDEVGPLVDAYNRDCAHKRMNPKDIAALPPELRTLMTSNATTSTIMVPAPKRGRR